MPVTLPLLAVDYGNSRLMADRHYATMSIEQMSLLPVKDHVTDHAVLFLWVPAPMLMKARDVIEAWGFTYKAGFVWDKIAHNFSNDVSARHEHLLLWDMKRGTRNGLWAEMMKPIVANLTADDMTAIVAYLASIKPPAPTLTSSR